MLSEQEILETIKAYPITTGVPRTDYVSHFAQYLNRKEILVLKGVRRCGKSTILKQLIAHLRQAGVPEKELWYVNLDDFHFLPHLSIELLETILKLVQKTAKRPYLFLDEIQKVPQFESWLRTHYDRETPAQFILSGSSASFFSHELGSLLTGRNITFEIHPLSFTEFLSFGKTSFEEYLLFGGFPEIVLEQDNSKKRTLLQQYIADIVTKDVIEQRNVRDTKQIMNFVRFLLANPGVRISVNTLAKQTELSKETVTNYLSYLKDAYLIFEVPFFSYSAKSKFIGSHIPKFYSIDNGFVTISAPRTEKGKLLESGIAQALWRKNHNLAYWKGTKEVDFITENTAIQVTLGPELSERETQALEELQNKHKTIKKHLIITQTKHKNTIEAATFLQKSKFAK